ncbi:RNA polymerase sigma-70 factor [Fulvivirgaceae bacterium BMA10]|uniref:RNA polymerase sigma-70 factor n=1 Tax=Splendidivirga corallicola TaxID=3051826 RepID=A0ABT8KN07_9BACT|nr:RNA polymerase sigma-70 factor [Fulvivirgaceae bacterium BMA10]
MQSRDLQHIDDHELLNLLSQNNDFAFEEIYNRYWEKLIRNALNIIEDKDTCKDILQEVFVNLWQRRSLVRINNLSAYLFRAVKLKVLEHLRNGNITQKHLNKINTISFANNTEDQIRLKDVEVAFDKSVSRLPDRCKEVFQLSRFEHLSNKEIAGRLNISIKTVEGHITVALKHLHKDLGEFVSIGVLYFFL